MGKPKTSQSSGKRTTVEQIGVNLGLMESCSTYMGTFGLVVFKVIWGSFGALCVVFFFLRKYDLENAAFSVLSFTGKLSQLFLLTVHIKVACWNFEI